MYVDYSKIFILWLSMHFFQNLETQFT